MTGPTALVRLANDLDAGCSAVGELPLRDVRRTERTARVDPQTLRLVLPEAVADELGLTPAGTARVTYADGSVETRDWVRHVRLSMAERDGVYKAIVEPGPADVVVGRLVLDDLDLFVDPVTKRCLPRDPEVMLSEIGSDAIPPTPR